MEQRGAALSLPITSETKKIDTLTTLIIYIFTLLSLSIKFRKVTSNQNGNTTEEIIDKGVGKTIFSECSTCDWKNYDLHDPNL